MATGQAAEGGELNISGPTIYRIANGHIVSSGAIVKMLACEYLDDKFWLSDA